MAAEGFTATHQQSVGHRYGLAVAEAEGSPAGAEGEQAGHGVGQAVRVLQLPAQQQKTAAFGHDRQAGLGGGPEGSEAAAAGRQTGGMEFGVAAGQQHRPAVRGRGSSARGSRARG